MRSSLRLAILGAALLSLVRLAHAETFPWLTIGADDVRHIESAKTDLNLRLDLINAAHDSIDFAVYDLRPDKDVTYPILFALRQAADRGVRVRVLTSYIPQLGFDRRKHLAHYLMQPPTQMPIEIEVIGGKSIETWKWGALDTIHEKFFMVDHKFMLTTGRGMGENYLHWLDTDFAIRGELAHQGEQAFEDVWNAARRQRSLLSHSLLWDFDRYANVTPYHFPKELLPTPAEEAELRSLMRWFNEPSNTKHGTALARVLHHDFLHQLENLPSPRKLGTAERVGLLDDPIIDAVAERLAGAKVARLSAISLILNPKLKDALISAARHGTYITVMTNASTPQLGGFLKSFVSPGGPIWDVELPDLDDLVRAGVNVRLFQVNNDTPWVYLHRKLAIIDDTVILGSHNLNLPSTVYNDETSYEIVNPAFAKEMATVFDTDMGTNSMGVDPAGIHQQRMSTKEKILDSLLSPLVGLM